MQLRMLILTILLRGAYSVGVPRRRPSIFKRHVPRLAAAASGGGARKHTHTLGETNHRVWSIGNESRLIWSGPMHGSRAPLRSDFASGPAWQLGAAAAATYQVATTTMAAAGRVHLRYES